MIVSIIIVRFRYYFAWKLADVSFISCGFGYNGYEESEKGEIKLKFDRFKTCDILKIELAKNAREVSIYWNSKVATWLRICKHLKKKNESSLKI